MFTMTKSGFSFPDESQVRQSCLSHHIDIPAATNVCGHLTDFWLWGERFSLPYYAAGSLRVYLRPWRHLGLCHCGKDVTLSLPFLRLWRGTEVTVYCPKQKLNMQAQDHQTTVITWAKGNIVNKGMRGRRKKWTVKTNFRPIAGQLSLYNYRLTRVVRWCE